jgi:hypothetical protein
VIAGGTLHRSTIPCESNGAKRDTQLWVSPKHARPIHAKDGTSSVSIVLAQTTNPNSSHSFRSDCCSRDFLTTRSRTSTFTKSPPLPSASHTGMSDLRHKRRKSCGPSRPIRGLRRVWRTSWFLPFPTPSRCTVLFSWRHYHISRYASQQPFSSFLRAVRLPRLPVFTRRPQPRDDARPLPARRLVQAVLHSFLLPFPVMVPMLAAHAHAVSRTRRWSIFATAQCPPPSRSADTASPAKNLRQRP